MARYNYLEIEQKWQTFWQDDQTFKTTEDPSYPKEKRAYILDMFPYPSGAGLHVGHPEGYTATDIYSRFLRANGYNVLHPMGFDSFGLPAENYAIQTGTAPLTTTETNISRFRKQIKRLGFSYDWDREIATHTPEYYKWTQWIFLQLYKKGLVYETEAPINWCSSCLTGLANEEVTNDGKCDRCGSPVSRKMLRQWIMKITAYAEQLLEGLNTLQWPEAVKTMQRNWIGKSVGTTVSFNIEGHTDTIKVFTTRPDTLFGVSYVVLAPEHSLLKTIVTANQQSAIQAYQEKTALKNDLDRTDLAKEKSGVFTGSYAINPINNEKIPIWISDYVLLSYGTGAVMAVPAHDERDFSFAKQFNLPLKVVVSADGVTLDTGCYTEEGININSGFANGMTTSQAKQAITKALIEKDKGEKTTHYKLRDWLFSRQRYWGEPIPLIHCPNCGLVAVPEDQLPLTLPVVESYKPTGTGQSPLAAIDDWVNCNCPTCGKPAKRETNTMPQWAGSCWYYLRYLDPKNNKDFCSKEKEHYWMPVNLYIGGAEHAVLHLLYSRFWHKVLFDLGLVSTNEPYANLMNQGMILGEDSQKMSKSRGNVVNPDDMMDQYGSDSLRLYEMFMGPLSVTKPWNTAGLGGMSRFLGRVWDTAQKPQSPNPPPSHLVKLLHKTIAKVTADCKNLEFNTAISQMMIFINDAIKEDFCYPLLWQDFIKLLAPFAPHLSEELWQLMGGTSSVCFQPWPVFDPSLVADNALTLGVQINGKVRAELTIAIDTPAEELIKQALKLAKIQEFIGDKPIKKSIAVPNKIINFVV